MSTPLQIELPHGTGEIAELGLPERHGIDPDTGLWVLESLTDFPFIAADYGSQWARICALATRVRVEAKGWYLDIRVGYGKGAATLEGSYFDASHGHVLRMRCRTCVESVCEHRLAAGLAFAWADPSWRARLTESAWSRFLAPLADRRAPTAPKEDDRPRGCVRVVLHAGPNGDSEIAEGRMSVMLVPLSKRSGQPLKPRPAPKSLAAAERKVRGLAEGDRALMRLMEQHRLLDHVHTYRYADSSRVQDELDRLERDIFAQLDAVSEVYLDDTPLTVDTRHWCTALRVTDGPQGGLRLRWAEAPRAVFPVDQGYVVDAGWRLRPLDPRLSLDALRLLERPPPAVPAGDIDSFIDRFVMATSIPVDVRARRLPMEDRTPTPRLVLRDDGGVLGVEVRFAYGAVEIDRHGPPVVRAPFSSRRVLIRRDLAAEAAAQRLLESALPDKPLRGEVAYDFLLHGVPRLEGWEITADKSLDLRKLKPHGTLEPQVRLKSGMNWFDLDVRFEVDGTTVSRTDVLRAWREGRRYVELSGGRVAELPEAWMARHAPALNELEEMRGRGNRLGAHAAPVAADLLAELGAGETAERWRDLAARIAAFDNVPERKTPKGLEATLRDYQHRGYRWMTAMRDLGLGAVLADDMGLGKTLQTLTVLLDTHRPTGRRRRKGPPSLVVAPTSVVHNWLAEGARFTPALRMHLHHGPKRGQPPEDVDVVVTSFALLRVDAEALGGRPWRVVVLDEAQHIKNPSAKIAQVARGVDAQYRLALTGTPLENHLIELWSIFQFLMPGFFGSRRAFQERYVRPIQKGTDPEARAQAMGALRRRIRPFVLRRLKREVATELPPRTEQVLYCDLGPSERRLYEAVKTTFRDTVLGRVETDGMGRATIQILEALTRLRQTACDPALLPFPEAAAVQASAKRALLRSTLAKATEEGHRALVFSQWPSLLKRVIPDLDGLGIDYLYLDGSTRERGNLQSQWNDPDGPPVFLISLKAGGTGLNLIGADVVVHLDPWWNPQVEAQATDRAHRIGQTKPVMVYKLVARGTVEEKILELQARKRSLFESAIDGDRIAVDTLTRADLEAVLAADDSALAAADELGEVVDEPSPDDSGELLPEVEPEAPTPRRTRRRKPRAAAPGQPADDSIPSTDTAPDGHGRDSAPADGEPADGVSIPPGEAPPPALIEDPPAAPAAPTEPSGAPDVELIELPSAPRAELQPDALPDAVAEALFAQGWIANRHVREALDCSTAEATRLLKRWTSQGLLTKKGRRMRTRYLPPS